MELALRAAVVCAIAGCITFTPIQKADTTVVAAAGCTAGASCGDGKVCGANQACRTVCSTADSCGACYGCTDGVCTPTPGCTVSTGAGAAQPCDVTADCPASAAFCDQGFCRGCQSDHECEQADATKRYCAANGVCGACASDSACLVDAPICDKSTLACRTCADSGECATRDATTPSCVGGQCFACAQSGAFVGCANGNEIVTCGPALTGVTNPCPDDTNPCTDAACDPQLGCVQVARTSGACDLDGNACTDGTCQSGTCVEVAKNCSDSIDCTTDACSGGTCSHTPNNGACDDGVTCTVNTCNPALGPGTGCAFPPNNAACNDNNSCTTDVCVGVSGGTGGCTNTALADFTACNDGNAATHPDVCWQTSCTGAASNTLSDGACDMVPVDATNFHSDAGDQFFAAINAQNCANTAFLYQVSGTSFSQIGFQSGSAHGISTGTDRLDDHLFVTGIASGAPLLGVYTVPYMNPGGANLAWTGTTYHTTLSGMNMGVIESTRKYDADDPPPAICAPPPPCGPVENFNENLWFFGTNLTGPPLARVVHCIFAPDTGSPSCADVTGDLANTPGGRTVDGLEVSIRFNGITGKHNYSTSIATWVSFGQESTIRTDSSGDMVIDPNSPAPFDDTTIDLYGSVKRSEFETFHYGSGGVIRCTLASQTASPRVWTCASTPLSGHTWTNGKLIPVSNTLVLVAADRLTILPSGANATVAASWQEIVFTDPSISLKAVAGLGVTTNSMVGATWYVLGSEPSAPHVRTRLYYLQF
jgi:hypothetical protein